MDTHVAGLWWRGNGPGRRERTAMLREGTDNSFASGILFGPSTGGGGAKVVVTPGPNEPRLTNINSKPLRN